MNIRTVSSDQAVYEHSDGNLKCNCAANEIHVYLHPSKEYSGPITLHKVDVTPNLAVIHAHGNERIDGSPTIALVTVGDRVTLSPVSSGWTVTDAAASAARLIDLGAPIAADDDRIVTSTDMKEGEYVIAAQPDVPRNITVTVTAQDTPDTLGTITIYGTNYIGQEISEVIVPEAGSTVAGTKAFKTITSIVGEGWEIDEEEGSEDLIEIGIGNKLGLPYASKSIPLGILGTAIVAHNPETSDLVEETLVDMSAASYNGTKKAFVFVTD